jgi:hypothetical protein
VEGRGYQKNPMNLAARTLQRTLEYILLLPPWGGADNEVSGYGSICVEESKRAYQDAKRNFWEIASKPREWPTSGLPHPDGSDLFRRVLAHERFTLKAHVEAMVRLNRYLLEGTIPADVQARLGKPKAEASG